MQKEESFLWEKYYLGNKYIVSIFMEFLTSWHFSITFWTIDEANFLWLESLSQMKGNKTVWT